MYKRQEWNRTKDTIVDDACVVNVVEVVGGCITGQTVVESATLQAVRNRTGYALTLNWRCIIQI